MAGKDKDAPGPGGDFARRMDAGTELLGVVGALIEPLAQLEQACARKRPGRLSAIDWVSDSEPLQQTLEKHAALLQDLGGQLQRAAGELVKIAPKPKDREGAPPQVATSGGGGPTPLRPPNKPS
jgi:hypothetical protein